MRQCHMKRSASGGQLFGWRVRPSNARVGAVRAFGRTVQHRGRGALVLNGVLASLGWAPLSAAVRRQRKVNVMRSFLPLLAVFGFSTSVAAVSSGEHLAYVVAASIATTKPQRTLSMPL